MRAPTSLSLEDEADRVPGTPHPRFASVLIGHAERERELLDAYRRNRLPHTIILAGQASIGKATLAWRLARFLAVNPHRTSPAVVDAVDLSVLPGAKAAREIASLAHPDVVLLRREMNEKSKRFFTEIRADDVRRAIALFQRAAGAGGYRICIVDSADDLNRSSANALLKLIEEPPPLSLFLLIAHRPGLVLPTIRSRARLVRLESLHPAEIEQVVGTLSAPWTEMAPSTVTKAAARADGSVHAALRLLAGRGTDLDESIERLLDGLPALDWRELHRLGDRVAGRDGDVAYETAMTIVLDWIARAVRDGASKGPLRLAPLAEAWERIMAQAHETDALNLDRRPLILSTFATLATAVRSAR